MSNGRAKRSTPSLPVQALLDWYGLHARDLPWRRTQDPYLIWVSEIMLQQTQVTTVVPYWERWRRTLPDVATLAAAAEQTVLKLWEGLGYYRRVRHLQSAARVIVERHGGRFPGSFEEILALPGVGRYTAGAISSIAFDQPTPVLDGNVIRVLCRFGAIAGDPKDRRVNEHLWGEATRWVKSASATGRPLSCSHINQALMELGAIVCTPRAPACEQCPLANGCQARAAGQWERYPQIGERVRATPREFAVAVIVRGGNVWLRQRASDEVNGSLWEFPNVEVESGQAGAEGLLRTRFGPSLLGSLEPLGVVRHSITRYRILQRAYVVHWRGGRRPVPGGGEWWPGEKLLERPMSSAHRRIAGLLGKWKGG